MKKLIIIGQIEILIRCATICPRDNVTWGLMRENLAALKYLLLQYVLTKGIPFYQCRILMALHRDSFGNPIGQESNNFSPLDTDYINSSITFCKQFFKQVLRTLRIDNSPCAPFCHGRSILQRDSHYSRFLDDKCIFTHHLHSYFYIF